MNNLDEITEISQTFGKLMDLIVTLRSENGCPWDRKQNPMSFHSYILEEYHELVEAINQRSNSGIIDEMGDLLFLVIFLGYMFQQQEGLPIKNMIEGDITKMTRRHPHVFGNMEVADSQEVIDNWARIKASEKNISARKSLLDGIPRSLPALGRAQKLARRAARVGFDWTRPEEVFNKVDEELGELKLAVKAASEENIREEIGDLLFVIVNVARHLDVNSETALNETSDKFERRFRHIEQELKSRGKSLEDASLTEMDELWDEAKLLERANTGEKHKGGN
jgi:MazG family protein